MIDRTPEMLIEWAFPGVFYAFILILAVSLSDKHSAQIIIGIGVDHHSAVIFDTANQ